VLTALQAGGLHGTFYAITGSIGAPNYLTLENLQTIHAAGNDIGGRSDDGTVHGAASEDRESRRLAADLENRDIAIRHKPPFLEGVTKDKIGRRAEAAHSQFFPLQILGFLYFRCRNNAEIDDIDQTSQYNRIGALQARQYRRFTANNRDG
jgi:hypothetical protein